MSDDALIGRINRCIQSGGHYDTALETDHRFLATRVASPTVGGVTISSTRYCRWRTRAICPGSVGGGVIIEPRGDPPAGVGIPPDGRWKV
jgi:hypothetical protein